MILFGFVRLSDSQNITSNIGKIITNKNLVPLPFNVAVTNAPTAVSLSCSIALWTTGYSNANILVTPLVNNNFTVSLSNLVVGRVSDIQCGLVGISSVTNATISLSVRPNPAAQVCSNVTAAIIPGVAITANVVVQFTYSLSSAATVVCTSAKLNGSQIANPTSGSTSVAMTLTFGSNVNPTETVSCNFTMGNVTNTFQFFVNFYQAGIYFSPSTIVTDSPMITLYLFINHQPNQNQQLQCYAVTNIIGFNCSNISASNLQSNWNITSSALFPANSAINTQTLSLVKTVSTPGVSETFTSVCCNSNFQATASVTLNYPSSDNSLQALFDVSSDRSVINITVQASTGETVYPYIQFYQLSSCPCDLTVAACDLNCCCDPYCDCSSSNVIPISGPYGGYFNDTPTHSCQTPYQLTTPPYHSLLCVQFNTSNIVGYYYNTTTLLQTGDVFQSALNSVNRKSFQFSVATQEITSNRIVAYTANGVIPTFFYMPKSIVNSVTCDLYSPVIFMQSSDSSCPYTVTNSNCQSMVDPRLSYANYLISSTAIEANCINNISLMNINQNTPVYTFYTAPGSSAWDNGYTLPSGPVLNTTNNTCDNVVTSVNYTVVYNKDGIVYINANIVMGSVILGTSVYQRFILSFLSTNLSTTALVTGSLLTIQNSVAQLSATQNQSSGLFGYEDGLPVLLADGSALKTFAPSVSGICQPSSGGRSVMFRKDSFMQCQHTITSSTCTDRRAELQGYLDRFLSNQSVAIYGSPTSSADYVTVTTIPVPAVLASVTLPSRNPNATYYTYPIDYMAKFCENAATGVFLTVYYSRQGKARGQYIHNIRGVKKSYILGNLTALSPNGGAANNVITLTSTIEFVLVSANIAGSQNTDDVTKVVCNFDVCIEELLYPWLLNYEGKQGFYELTFGVMLLGLAVFLLVTTNPWW